MSSMIMSELDSLIGSRRCQSADSGGLDSQTCVEDPRDTCDPYAGGADCSGVCVYLDGRSAASTPTSGQLCGGFAGFQCPEGKTCVDNPNDGCDPKKGGADCSGICV